MARLSINNINQAMANSSLSKSGTDLVAMMLRAAGLADDENAHPMDEARQTFYEVSNTLERLKLNHEKVAQTEQEKLVIAYKGFLVQSGHEIEELRKKYNVENLKLMYNQTFRSLEKAFLALKAESKTFVLR